MEAHVRAGRNASGDGTSGDDEQQATGSATETAMPVGRKSTPMLPPAAPRTDDDRPIADATPDGWSASKR